MFVTSYRVTKFAFQNFWRNFWLSFITLSMLVLTLLTVNVLIVLNVVGERAIELVENRVELSVYFNEDVSSDQAGDAASFLRGLSRVRDVEIISSEVALERFQERHIGDTAILQSIDEIGGNPFGPTLIVKANGTEDFPFIIESLENPRFSDGIRDKDFSDYETIIQDIQRTAERIRVFGLGLTVFFLVIALLIVFNTVRMAVFIHREEISIMKLVGASNWFVRAPFLLEAILLSIASVAVTIALTFPVLASLQTKFDVYFDGQAVDLLTYFTENGLHIFGGQVLAVMFITLFATWVAMRKYLRA